MTFVLPGPLSSDWGQLIPEEQNKDKVTPNVQVFRQILISSDDQLQNFNLCFITNTRNPRRK